MEYYDLISRFSYSDLLKAGNLKMLELYNKGPKNFEDYLLKIKSLMCRLEYKKELINPDDPNYGMNLHSAFINLIDPIKTKEQNDVWLFMWENRERLEKMIDLQKDFIFNYLSVSNFESMYLLRQKYNSEIVELPQYLFMRVAVTLHFPNFEKIENAYNDYSNLKRFPASPTLFNAGTTFSQMSSCFLVRIEDNLPSILWSLYVIGTISKVKGATGLSFGSLRGSGSSIASNGVCSGTLNLLKNIDANISYVSQGGNRPGSAQVCLPIWHPDIFGHIEATLKTGSQDLRIKKANTSVAFYDLFFERVEEDSDWSLFCPSEVPLSLLYGEEFRSLYLKAEAEGKAKNKIKAKTLLLMIANSLRESGNPYLINLDSINLKSNQKNIGTITTLNLCQEIALVADQKRIPSCNLNSICLLSFVKNKKFDFLELARVTKEAVYDLNAIIERNYYPLPEIKFANYESAPIGIGFQGAIDTILEMDILFDSKEAEELIEKISACVYFNALKASNQIAKEKGAYKAFINSPFSQGILQFDLWEKTPLDPKVWGETETWEELKESIKKYGIANSQLTTSQPTASVSTLTGLGEGWEPFYANVFQRELNKGSFRVVNSYLQKDLEEIGLWNDDVIKWIQIKEGSIQGITEKIENSPLKEKYIGRLQYIEKKHRTVFEYDSKLLMKHAAIRGPYIDGSQSTNAYLKESSKENIINLILYAQSLKLKTLIYYLRTKETKSAIKQIRLKNDKLAFSENVCIRTEGCISCQ